MLEIQVKVEPDRRYRTLVSLVRTDRPKYWTFHCPKCATPVAEIVNCEVQALSDLIDYSNISNIGAGWRCHGTFGRGMRCDNWYYFNLG